MIAFGSNDTASYDSKTGATESALITAIAMLNEVMEAQEAGMLNEPGFVDWNAMRTQLTQIEARADAGAER